MTLKDALEVASRYWDLNRNPHSRGPCMMTLRATRCTNLLGPALKLASLTPAHGTKLLGSLREASLSRASVKSYYAAFTRMLSLNGVSTHLWPKAPVPPRKLKPPVKAEYSEQLIEGLEARGWSDTADLVRVLRGTGMRIEVEALRGETILRGAYMEVIGKQGHERLVPVADDLRLTLQERTYQGITYEGHLRRWKEVCKELGLPDHFRPHALRRRYAAEQYDASGKDLVRVQALLGHSSPGTTSGYVMGGQQGEEG